MVAQAENLVEDPEPILYSSYPSIPVPALKSFSAAELLLEKAREQTANGKTKWLVR